MAATTPRGALLRDDDPIKMEAVGFAYEGAEGPVLRGVDLGFPAGFTCLMGPNGSGKTTTMLLASGRIPPASGRVTILGRDASTLGDEEERNLLASVVYQNMEFDTEEAIGPLLDFVLRQGARRDEAGSAVDELVAAFALGPELGKRPAQLSKGAHQRFILALSLLYGSPVLMLDEPVFALTEAEKDAALGFVRALARARGILVVASLHELDLSSAHADTVVLFDARGPLARGNAADILADRPLLEQAYGVPYALLRQKETLKRDMLLGGR